MRLILLTTLTMLAFAANSVLNRMAVAGGEIGPFAYGAVRVASGALILAALAYGLRGRLSMFAPGRAAAVAALLIYIFGFTAAYVALDAGLGALVLFGMVQITMFAGAALARERMPLLRWIGAALAFGGLILLLAPGNGTVSLPHVALMAAAGIGWGLYSLAGRGAPDALAATAANFVLAVPLATLAGVAALPSEGAPTPTGLALAVLSGAVTSGLGYALWYSVLPALGATRSAVAQLTVPVIAASAGLVLLGEVMSLRFVAASALVLGGVVLSLLRR